MDQKFIKSRLDRITDLDDRRLMKRILNEVFEDTADYNMQIYKNLEKRICDEIEDPLDKMYIYSSLINKSDIDPISNFFHPVVASDKEETVDLAELNKKISASGNAVLTSIFLKCDYLKFNEIINDKRIYKAVIKTDKGIYEANTILKQSFKYINAIESLYHVFQVNSLEWNTLNCPYFYRFADVVLSSPVSLKNDEKITEITVDLGINEKYKELSLIPVWNIKPIVLQDKSFPMPAGDRINNEHSISVAETGSQNGYIIDSDNPDFKYAKRYENDLIIISDSEEQFNWNILQIENIENNKKGNYNYEILSNRRNLSFAGKLASVKSLVIRTKAEVDRIITSYTVSRDLAFVDLEVKKEYKKEIQTVDYNEFIDDNIRSDKSKRFLVIKFTSSNEKDFLIYDKMSFLVSEIQILFPEYRCVGELV